jgi:glucose/arabinose dehydrogenase
MRHRSILGLLTTTIIVPVLGFIAFAPTPQATVSAQPQATATVNANQTATAQAQATAAATPRPAEPTPTPASAESNTLVPEQRGFSEALARENLRVPQGFWIDIYATNMGNVRMMVVAPDGTLYVTRRTQGDVLALNDRDNNGRVDQVRTIASELKLVHGIALHAGYMYLATDTVVYKARLKNDGTIETPRVIIRDLPSGGQHPNRTLAVGPDGLLYITVGSTCNACTESDPRSATILRSTLNGEKLEVFARGLRNTIGFGWHPASGQMWGFDHGSDGRGDDQPPEELNLLRPAGNYGWPYCYGNQQPDVYFNQNPPGTTKEAYCPTTLAPVMTYQAHSAPIGMIFYTSTQFPAAYTNDAFVAMRGSWNRDPATGYKIVRVLYENGWPVGFEDFLTGFLIENGGAYFGRPAGMALAPYGSIFISDDANGVIYRVSWAGR